jgi:hypothetical protein
LKPTTGEAPGSAAARIVPPTRETAGVGCSGVVPVHAGERHGGREARDAQPEIETPRGAHARTLANSPHRAGCYGTAGRYAVAEPAVASDPHVRVGNAGARGAPRRRSAPTRPRIHLPRGGPHELGLPVARAPRSMSATNRPRGGAAPGASSSTTTLETFRQQVAERVCHAGGRRRSALRARRGTPSRSPPPPRARGGRSTRRNACASRYGSMSKPVPSRGGRQRTRRVRAEHRLSTTVVRARIGAPHGALASPDRPHEASRRTSRDP